MSINHVWLCVLAANIFSVFWLFFDLAFNALILFFTIHNASICFSLVFHIMFEQSLNFYFELMTKILLSKSITNVIETTK